MRNFQLKKCRFALRHGAVESGFIIVISFFINIEFIYLKNYEHDLNKMIQSLDSSCKISRIFRTIKKRFRAFWSIQHIIIILDNRQSLFMTTFVASVYRNE